MTTGALIYLVSACGSGEEFVAAFRRYADRSGLFVPMADPIATGRRGRFAVTLGDGGVMLEGEAEVVSSARTPSVLFGRVGMTLRFTGPDEQSRIVLAELERARLAAKPPPPSVPPRPAEIPAAPRPVPPAPGGRIDAASALAECVAIGDLAALAVVEKAGPKTGQKFVVPTILPVASKPAAAAPPATLYDEDVELPMLAELGEIEVGSRGVNGALEVRATEIPIPAQIALATEPSRPVRHGPASEPTIPAQHGPASEPTIPAQPGPSSSSLRVPASNEAELDSTRVPRPATATPPSMPIAKPLPEPRRASERLPSVLAPAPRRPTGPLAQPAAPARPPNIEEPTPSGDWTMIPGPDGPTLQPPAPPKPRESLPTGNWSIAIDPQSSDGWSEPAKLEPTARPKSGPMSVVSSSRPLESEPQQPAVNRLDLSEPKVQIDPTLIEPLVPLPAEAAPAPVRSSSSQPAMDLPMAASSSNGMRLQQLLTPVPGFLPPYPTHPADLGQAAAAPGFDAAIGPPAHYSSGAIQPIRPRRTRTLLIVGSAAIVLGTATAVFLILSNRGTGRADEAAAQPSPEQPSPATQAPADAAEARAAAAAPEAGAASPPPGGCAFDVATAPPGAEVLTETGEVIATAPAKLTLPCDVEVKLTFRKARYVTAERKYTPAASGKPLKVALARPTVLIKVSSSPSGAAVTVGGKPQGFTPTTIRLPLHAESTLTISKDGYTPDTQKLTPKQNNQAVNAILKRAPRSAPR